MKKLEDFKDEINKCSKCGLCQSVCPVYKETGNDCAVSRGKFVMLDGVLKGDLTLNKNIEKYLDMCLKCGKCSDFCPSSIDVCQIFTTAKSENFKKSILSKLTAFLQSDFVFGNFIKFCTSFWKVLNTKNKEILCFKKLRMTKYKTKLLYFKGCVNNIYPKVETALKKVLSHFDVELIEKDFDCCGVPFLSSGNLEQFEKSALKNAKLIEETNFDYILTDCASCASALKDYPKYIETPLNANFINIGEFLSTQNAEFIFKKPVKVTFHKPCHLENTDFLKPLLEKCKNVEYIEMEGFEDCCGLAGEFALKNPKISREISKKKAKHIIAAETDFVLTSCPACVIGILKGFTESGLSPLNAPKVLNIVEFLAKAKEIKVAKSKK